MENDEGKAEGPSRTEEVSSSFTPIKAVMPISMMVVLIITTLALALWIGPYFDALGITSEMSEYADNPLYAFVFLGFVIAFAVFILLLRKLLKRRRLKLKYIFAIAVLFSTLYILTPLVDIVANGFPETWENYDMDIDEMRGALPLDPENPGTGLIAVTDTSFHVLERKEYEYEEIWSVEDLDSTFDPHFSGGLWVFAGTMNGEYSYWTVDIYGTETSSGVPENNDTASVLIGISVAFVNDEHYLINFWEGNGNWTLSSTKVGEEGPGTRIENIGINEGPFIPVSGWSDDRIHYTRENEVRYMILTVSDSGLKATSGGGSGLRNRTWISARGEYAISFTNDPTTIPHEEDISRNTVVVNMQIIEGSTISMSVFNYATTTIISPYHVSYAHDRESGTTLEDFRLIYLYGKEVGVKAPGSHDKYTFTSEPLSVFQDGTDGDIYLVFDGTVLKGQFDEKERMQLWIQVTAFIIAVGMMILLLRIPKWWIIDLSGILMGAGVVAMMGTSFPLLFTILLMILLAVYDAISVYKTKHMISLADAVVESKMPILLVFPMRLDYRYEDETNLMDPKRKRESLFMGLGDVIIPGILVVSSFAWLPGAPGIFGLSGPFTVAIFTMAGMLAGYGILMRWVLKGKAHAGLPPLNGGAILGFIIGHLLVYGSIIFW
jgi:presenilin-like A22 family membrane protease